MAIEFTSNDWLSTLYLAYWGRAADPNGLNYWVGQWGEEDAEGNTKDGAWFASNFALQEEAEDEFAFFAAYNAGEEITDQMREDFVDAIYQNLFSRQPDAEGKEYWLGLLSSGDVDPGKFIGDVVYAALEDETGNDAQTLLAKKTVADFITEQADASDWSEAEILAYVQGEEAGSIIANTTPDNVADQQAVADNDIPDPVIPGETFTLTEAITAEDAGTLPDQYIIEDNIGHLTTNTFSEMQLIDAAQEVNVLGDATAQQIVDFNANYDNLNTYSLADTTANLLDDAYSDIVAGAESITVSEPLTVSEYNTFDADFTPEFDYQLADTLANLVDAGEGVVDGAESYSLIDATYKFEGRTVADALSEAQQTMLEGASNSEDYTYSLNDSLEHLMGADEGVVSAADSYTVDATTVVYDAGEMTVAEANTEYAEASSLIEGAQNSDDLNLDNLYDYSLADTYENLVAADEGVVDGADEYSLTNEPGDLGELTGDEYAVVDGATNTDDYTFTVEPADVLSINSVDSTVVEGNTISFDVELSHAVNVDRVLNYTIAGEDTDAANAADPLTDLGQINGNVTVAAGETTATITLTPTVDATEGLEAFSVKVLDEDFAVAQTTDPITIQDAPNSGQTFTLTASVDEFVGGAGNDTFIGLVDDAGDSTVTTLDSIDGGDGVDTFKMSVIDAPVVGLPTIDIANIETFNLRTADALTENLTDYGFSTVNVTQNADALDLTAGDTTAFNVTHAGALASTTLDGGSTQTVNVGNGAVTLTGAAGAISVTHADQVAGKDISTTHGTDVTIVANADESSGDISVGDGTDNQSGAVNITQNLTSDGAALTGGAVAVDGGTTVDVTINGAITADAVADNSNSLDAGDVSVTSDGNTTDVTITQNLTATDYSKDATDDVPATQVLTFDALAQDETVIVEGLTFTASKALTAEEVAAAFANLGEDSGAGNVPSAGDIVSAGGPVTNGVYSGTFSDGTWTSGAANGANVTFTADQGTGAMTINAGDQTPDDDYDAGTDNSGTAESGDVSVTYGAVTIEDDATASIENITVDGYGISTIGAAVGTDALKTLSLANSAGTMGVTTAAATLDLTVDDVNDAVTLTAASLLDLTLNAVGGDSAFALTSANTTDLTIDATADLDLSGSTFTALVNATIGGAGEVTLDGQVAATLETIDAAGNTGGVTASVNGDATEVTGGDGGDDITVLNAGTAIDKAMALGAGDDILDISNGGTVTATEPSATLDGGADIDLLVMDSAAAAGANAAFAGKFTNFEILEIADQVDISAGDVTVDMSVLEYNHVVTNGTESGAVTTSDGTFTNALIFNSVANGSTFVLNDAQVATTATGTDIGSIKVNVTDADINDADSLILITDAHAGDVEVPDVETVNVTGKDSVNLKGDALTTVNVNANDVATTDADGNPLTYSPIEVGLDAASTNVEMVDASMSKGAFTFDSLDDGTATEIYGGEGNDEISIAGQNDEVYAGAGNDRIIVDSTADAAKAEGGDGNDLFDMTTATLGKEAYATILDFNTGDQIQMNADTFKSEGVVVTDPEAMTLTDWFTAAFNQTTTGDAIWFEHNENTYIVDNAGSNDFDAGSDVIVKLSGVHDLENNAAFNDSGILEMA